jgi:ligand-binding sensor protein
MTRSKRIWNASGIRSVCFTKEGKEVSKLMEFLYTCIKLIQDESIVQELQNLIRQYEIGNIDLY